MIGEQAYMLTISPEGLKLVVKGKRNGMELAWKALVSGDTRSPPRSMLRSATDRQSNKAGAEARLERAEQPRRCRATSCSAIAAMSVCAATVARSWSSRKDTPS